MTDELRQKETEFQPTPKMLKVLEAAINPEVDANISAWCTEAEVSRADWYRWQDIEGFDDWFHGEFTKAMKRVRSALVKKGYQKALDGDFQFWKVMMEKSGEYGPSLKLTGDEERPLVFKNLDVEKMSDEQLDQFLQETKKG
jgi:hypothetical protein